MSEPTSLNMATKIFLAVSILLWLPYGLYCTVAPT